MSASSPPRIVVAGAVAQKPGKAGHAWVFLQYLLGLRDLGFRPLFIDQVHDPLQEEQRLWFQRVLSFPDPPLEGVLLDAQGGVAALSRSLREAGARADCAALVEESVALINVQGYLRDGELMQAARRRIFLDIDPGFTQMWQDLGLTDFLDGHHAYATVGGRIGRDDCPIPACGKSWIHFLPPVHLPSWPPVSRPSSGLTSVISWRGAYGPLEYRGRTYGLRVHEFRRFWDLPSGIDDVRFQLAIDLSPADETDRESLISRGWEVLPSREAAGDLDSYRDYIGSSLGEFLVAKNIYVDTRCGWFSDRSACYLASGRPVLAQDTGLGDRLPAGEGLLIFSTPQEATRQIRRLLDDYPAHARAARRLAERHLDARRVLRRLLEQAGVEPC
ncbi:MAG TPA: glycosyltransferase [Acidobacteriota bacterium]|nr:glycosyltransferase [Acidobacteriota bacterium]